MSKARAKKTSPRTGTAIGTPAPQITIRMYREILGDCFLLRFPGNARDVFVLIDCGALQGMPGAPKRMCDIAADIAKTTGSHLDVLVITHEHWDHVSGFEQAKCVFDDFEIDELWLAWTEDDGDASARSIRDRRRKTLDLLLKLHSYVANATSTSEDDDFDDTPQPPREQASLASLLGFAGLAPDVGAIGQRTAGQIIAGLRAQAKRVRYWTPGADPIPLPNNGHVRVYVLGPPKDESFLHRSRPKKGEVYGLWSDTGELGTYLTAALRLDKTEEELDADERREFALSMPFNAAHFRRTAEARENLERLEPSCGVTTVEKLYFDPESEWRRIDRDWLGAAEQLALKLDSDTNNTSLALAFVLGARPDSPALLFPGDAQVGNWLSWQQYAWPKGVDRHSADAMTIEKLLASTVLYKVGHHCSHNATLREGGLELMTHRDLVAMIPVQENFARETKRWNMPFPSLLERLNERARGRIFRADRGKDALEQELKKRWDESGELSEFLSRVREGQGKDGKPLFIEYDIPVDRGEVRDGQRRSNP
jgi:hypothetical protein